MALEVLPPRRASIKSKYLEELRVDTTGFLAGACMKEIKRDEGLYYVQVADHPVPDIEGREWWYKWFELIVEKSTMLLPLAGVRTEEGCALNEKARFLAFKERGGIGFRRYGFYERVFVDDKGEIIKEPSKEQMLPAKMRYVNMYTMEQCEVTTFESVKSAAKGESVWYFEGADVAFVRYELQMEVYKIYVDSWHNWAERLGFYAWEVIEGVVSMPCVLV